MKCFSSTVNHTPVAALFPTSSLANI